MFEYRNASHPQPQSSSSFTDSTITQPPNSPSATAITKQPLRPSPSRKMPKHTYPHTYPPRKRLHLHKTHLLDLPDDVLIRIIALLQPPLHTLSGRTLTHPPPAFALSQTCKRLHTAFLDSVTPQPIRLDAAPHRFTTLLHHHPGTRPRHIARIVETLGSGLAVIRLPRYDSVDPSPVLSAAGTVCSKLESFAFADGALVEYDTANLLFTSNPRLQRITIYAPGIPVLAALTAFGGALTKLALHSLKAAVLPAVRDLLVAQGRSVRYLTLGFDHTDFMKTISTPWKYDPLRPFHQFLNFVKDNLHLLPAIEKVSINLGGRSHFADGLDLLWFQKLSEHCEVEVHSADGALSIPAKSGVAGVHFVKSLNLGTIFTGPGTYRIGCPNRIDLSNHGFIVKYANGAPIIKERVRSLVKTVVRHSAKSPALLSVHVGMASLRAMKMVCRTVTDMLALVPDVTELEISREIVEFAYDHIHELRYRKMFSRLKNIRLLHLVAVKCGKESTGIDHTDKFYERQKRGRFLRALPEFLRIVSAACGKMECVLLDDFGTYDGGLKNDIEGALLAVGWLERERRDLDVGSIKGLLENWKSIDRRIAAGEIVW